MVNGNLSLLCVPIARTRIAVSESWHGYALFETPRVAWAVGWEVLQGAQQGDELDLLRSETCPFTRAGAPEIVRLKRTVAASRMVRVRSQSNTARDESLLPKWHSLSVNIANPPFLSWISLLTFISSSPILRAAQRQLISDRVHIVAVNIFYFQVVRT